MDYKIIMWNCNGASNNGFISVVMDFVRQNNVSLLVLLEPKVSGFTANCVIRKLGFPFSHRVEAVGFSGGIWILWKSNTKFTVLSNNNQFIHGKVMVNNEQPFLFTAVYGNPHICLRKSLWPDLSNIALSVDIPWLIAGDFNAFMFSHEKIGGSLHGSKPCMLFQDFLHKCSLIDLGFQGPRFTWNRGFIFERLDRALSSVDWRLRFPNACVSHLPMIQSDHRPLLISLGTPRINSGSQFRFLSSWLLHKDFRGFVQAEWDSSVDVCSAMNIFTSKIKRWNHEVFGNIFHRKAKLLSRINGTQRALETRSCPFLVQLEKELRAEYETILHQEEVLWKQRSKDDWIKLGDRNTAYFHSKAVIKGRKSRIDRLRLSNEEWCSDQDLLKQHVTEFYKSLFSEDVDCAPGYPIQGKFPIISGVYSENLIASVTVDEVRAALFNMKPMKAPGKDGLPAVFFQSNWPVVQQSFLNFVQHVFDGGEINPKLNTAIITLIPKRGTPAYVTDLRPISLLPVVFKVLTKVVVNRLKIVMPLLVHPTQSSFIPGRCIVDNIIVVQEVIHSMKRKSGPKGWMVLKVDLEKAYDRLRWDFILDTLIDAGIPNSLIDVIRKSWHSSSTQILWDGSLSEPFSPSRGVRQGDPLSPYLFALCIERLSHGISTAVDMGLWNPIQLSRGGPKLSHMFFADDLIMFTEASEDQLNVVMNVLEDFCVCSGEKVNINKSAIFCSRNVSDTLASRLSEISGFNLTSDLGKYLGVPLLHGRAGVICYKYIVEKVQKKLSAWKAKTLSLAGRIELVRSVLLSIPYYTMQATMIPVTVCNSIEQLCRNFIWGSSQSERKVHLISWNKICQPTAAGGLGLRNLRLMNLAFMMKVAWGLVTKSDALWVQVLKSKYKFSKEEIPWSLKQRYGSPLWKGVCLVWPLVKKNCQWSLRSGKSVSLWNDRWVGGDLLSEALSVSMPCPLPNGRVCDAVLPDGQWNWNIFSGISTSLLVRIASIKPPSNSDGDDVAFWGLSPNGKFSVSSAYTFLGKEGWRDEAAYWNLAWRWNGPQRIRTFLWICFLQRHLTNSECFRRGLIGDPGCKTCTTEEETLLHCLRDCPLASVIWHKLLPISFRTTFFSVNLHEWLSTNLCPRTNSVKWNTVFGVTIWLIWKWRCAKVMRNESLSVERKVGIISAMVSSVQSSVFPSSVESGVHEVRRIEGNVSWKPPMNEFICLNTDGAMRKSISKATAGGCFRDRYGIWRGGFSLNLGNCSAFRAELWGVYHGLNEAWNRGYRQVILQVDNKSVVYAISGNSHHPCANSDLITSIIELRDRDWDVKIVHVFRESNSVADALANWAFSSSEHIIWHDSPPSRCSLYLHYDMQGVSYPRMIPLYSV